MQQRTYECVEKVASILQSQLDIEDAKEEKETKVEFKKEKEGSSACAICRCR